MIHRYMPIGREGWDLTPEQAAEAVADGDIAVCRQCSSERVTIYH